MKKYSVEYGVSRTLAHVESFDELRCAIEFAQRQTLSDFVKIVDNHPSGEITLVFTTSGLYGPHYVGLYFVQEKYDIVELNAPISFT